MVDEISNFNDFATERGVELGLTCAAAKTDIWPGRGFWLTITFQLK